MPTYDYVCRECEHRWELFQSIKANPIRKCPQCGRLKARREIGTGAGIIFKGSGFYQTDYRSASYKKKAAEEKKKAEGGSSSGKSESKSDGSSSKSASEGSQSTPKSDGGGKSNES